MQNQGKNYIEYRLKNMAFIVTFLYELVQHYPILEILRIPTLSESQVRATVHSIKG